MIHAENERFSISMLRGVAYALTLHYFELIVDHREMANGVSFVWYSIQQSE
jgi:hypothetical protein